jgi:DNA-binding SARP family transcriptional activator
MPHLKVRLFGKFSVLLNEKPVNGLDACKLQELFSYLLVYRDAPHARETLAALLWGESSTAQSKKYLRQALWQIQAALDSREHCKHDRVFHVEPDWIAVEEGADIWVDVAVFEQAFARAREVRGKHLDPLMAQGLENAVQLYQADFLAGWYQDWCVCERERLQTNYLIMLDKLMSYCEAQQKYETGLTYGLTVLRYDRARESTHRRLMRLHYLAGDRTGALRQYEHCVAALKEELGVKPSRHTVALYEQMRLDEFHSVAAPTEGQRRVDPSVLPTVINHLKQLRRALKEIHGHVQQDIKAVEAALDKWR